MSKKDTETRGPFIVRLAWLEEAVIYTTNGVIDFPLSSDLISLAPWAEIESAISAKMKTLGTEMTELARQRTQLGEALRSGDPRYPTIEEIKDEDSSGTSE